jgi:hypothetical protein
MRTSGIAPRHRLPAFGGVGLCRSRYVGEDPAQSSLQRIQVHIRGRDCGPSAVRRRRGKAKRQRQRHRDPGARSTAFVRALPSYRRTKEPDSRRQRHRPRVSPGTRQIPQGHDRGRQRGRSRDRLHGEPPARPIPSAIGSDRRRAHHGIDGSSLRSLCRGGAP